MSDAQVFIPRECSLSPVDLIPPDADEDGGFDEADERAARYARLGKLVDVEDIIEVVCTRLTESTQLALT